MSTHRYPLTKALVALIAGILLGGVTELPMVLSLPLAAVLFVVAWVVDYVAQWALLAAIILLGAIVGELSEPPRLEEGVVEAVVRVDRLTSVRGDKLLGEATLCAMLSDDKWCDVNASVRFRCDTSLSPRSADMLYALFYVRPYNPTASSHYERTMSRQGFAAELRYMSGSLISRSVDERSLGEELSHLALSRLEALPLSEESRGVVEATTTAHTSSLSASLRHIYSRSGMAHLLAISGLHIGFVLLFAMLIFRWVVLFRHGQIVLSVVVLVAVWLFALMAGLSPSVSRAAIMLTLYESLTLFARRSLALERLSFAALVMLLVDAGMLYDVGFQFSFVAVLAIVVWGSAWSRIWSGNSAEGDPSHHRRHSLVLRSLALCGRWLWRTFVISIAATVAILPLTSYYFGVMSLWSVVTSVLVIPLCGFVVCLGFVAILLPEGFLSGPIAWLLDMGVGVMNSVAEWCASHELLIAAWRIDGWMCVGLYAVMILLTMVATHKKTELPK